MSVEIARVPRATLQRGQLVKIEHPPFHVLLVLLDDGPHAIEDACPHSGRSLCDGALDGGVVTCAEHGWRIDVRTGAVVKPAIDERNPRYHAVLDGDEVVVFGPGA